MKNYLLQSAAAATMRVPSGVPAVDMYDDLREQGLPAAAAREHVRIVHGVDVTRDLFGSVVVTSSAPLPGARTGRIDCTRPNLSNPVLSHRRRAV